MDKTRHTYKPTGPASADQIPIELFSEQRHPPSSLDALLKKSVPEKSSILVIGANAGNVVQFLLPICSKIDIVTEENFRQILRIRFVQKLDIDYTFYGQGYIGEKCALVTNKTENHPEINIYDIQQFQEKCMTSPPTYDTILLQNVILHEKINIISELLQIKHSKLITMINPGKLLAKHNLFELLCGI